MLASTYPVYLAARSVAEGWRASPSSGWRRGRCPASHDYTLTVGDMKKLEGPTWWP